MQRLATTLGLLLLLSPVIADDVKIHVIPPNPPATQPGTTVQPTPQPTPTVSGVTHLPTSDWVMDASLAVARMTDGQTKAVQAILQNFAEDTKKLQPKWRARMDEAGLPVVSAIEAYRKKGVSDPTTRPDVKAMQEKAAAVADAIRCEGNARRMQLIDKLAPHLTPGQVKRMRDQVDEDGGTERGVARRMSRSMVLQVVGGAKLPEEQTEQVVDAVATVVEHGRKRLAELEADIQQAKTRAADERDNAAAQKAVEAASDAYGSAWVDIRKQVRRQVEALLDTRQREDLAADVRQAKEKSAAVDAEAAIKWIERIDLTEEQRQRVRELTEAARKAMADVVDVDDPYSRLSLVRQLRNDLLGLLTNEQKQQLRAKDMPAPRP